ncbi:MAG: PHP domain-containing protein, partial [Bacillota bacterium]|nr:PHP domain-containing protein [Bacillota bacterium]
ENGIDGFALSDHDTLGGCQEIPELSRKYGIKIIPAVEISTEEKERDVHILVYGLGEDHPHIEKLLSRLIRSRVSRIESMVVNLAKAGVNITTGEVLSAAQGGSPGRPHIAKVLMDHGYVTSISQAFSRYLGRGCPGYVCREKLSPVECIEIVLADGGLPVLAHPGLDEAYKLIPTLAKNGLWGLEVYHSSHSPGQERKFKALARKYDLRITGGSDFHGFINGEHGNIGSKYIISQDIDNFFSVDGGRNNVERI